MLEELRALRPSDRKRLQRPIAVFEKAHAAYAAAATETRRCERALGRLKFSMTRLADRDQELEDTKDAACTELQRAGCWPPVPGARSSTEVARALQAAERAESAQSRLWAPLVRASAEHQAARAKRKALVGLWEAAFRRVNELLGVPVQ